MIFAIKTKLEQKKTDLKDDSDSESKNQNPNRGTAIMDATACRQDILNLLNDAREKSEMLMDILNLKELHGKKPRTYREKARKV
jgi:IS5 family transposase